MEEDKERRNEMKQQLESFADASDAINYNAISRALRGRAECRRTRWKHARRNIGARRFVRQR